MFWILQYLEDYPNFIHLSFLFFFFVTFFFNLDISDLLNSNYGSIIVYWKHMTGSENSPNTNTNNTIFEEFTCGFTFCRIQKEWQPYCKNDKFVSRILSVLHPYATIFYTLALYMAG